MKLDVIRIRHGLPKGMRCAKGIMLNRRDAKSEVMTNELGGIERYHDVYTSEDLTPMWSDVDTNGDTSAPILLLPLRSDRGWHTRETG